MPPSGRPGPRPEAPPGNPTVFMLELWSSATTIATPRPAIRVRPPTDCGRASATASAAMASPRSRTGTDPSRCSPALPLPPKPSSEGQAIRGRDPLVPPGQRHQQQHD